VLDLPGHSSQVSSPWERFATSRFGEYDADAAMAFQFPRHAGFVCGTDRPPSKAAILVQRGNKP